MEIKTLLQKTLEMGASDLHICANSPPLVRVDGEIKPMDFPVLTPEDTRRLIYSLFTEKQRMEFEENKELDFSIHIPNLSRFRINVHYQKGNVEAAIRVVSLKIPTCEELGLPPVVKELALKSRGLVIITGPTGMGKTTTLASLIDLINSTKRCVIISIEDPIEYVHENKLSVVKQREVRSDTHSFAKALRHVLRQDPDVICIGEMRDLESISIALTAAETGHLVLTTLHTPDAAQTIDRIIDVFPPHQQQEVKVQLAGCLEGIVAQLLLPRSDGKGRVLATEILVATPAVRRVIREHRTDQIPTLIQTGSQFGMQSMDKSLKDLYLKGLISYQTAITFARNPEEFKKL